MYWLHKIFKNLFGSVSIVATHASVSSWTSPSLHFSVCSIPTEKYIEKKVSCQIICFKNQNTRKTFYPWLCHLCVLSRQLSAQYIFTDFSECMIFKYLHDFEDLKNGIFLCFRFWQNCHEITCVCVQNCIFRPNILAMQTLLLINFNLLTTVALPFLNKFTFASVNVCCNLVHVVR